MTLCALPLSTKKYLIQTTALHLCTSFTVKMQTCPALLGRKALWDVHAQMSEHFILMVMTHSPHSSVCMNEQERQLMPQPFFTCNSRGNHHHIKCYSRARKHRAILLENTDTVFIRETYTFKATLYHLQGIPAPPHPHRQVAAC